MIAQSRPLTIIHSTYVLSQRIVTIRRFNRVRTRHHTMVSVAAWVENTINSIRSTSNQPLPPIARNTAMTALLAQAIRTIPQLTAAIASCMAQEWLGHVLIAARRRQMIVPDLALARTPARRQRAHAAHAQNQVPPARQAATRP